MNERLRKLANQTDVWCDQNWHGYDFYYEKWEEKFAELILQDVTDILSGHLVKVDTEDNKYQFDFAYKHPIQVIQEQFGVKVTIPRFKKPYYQYSLF
jgi:hypothetical protein